MISTSQIVQKRNKNDKIDLSISINIFTRYFYKFRNVIKICTIKFLRKKFTS